MALQATMQRYRRWMTLGSGAPLLVGGLLLRYTFVIAGQIPSLLGV
jgi:hypothetical protein